MKKETREKLYKISEVAEILGVHEDTLRNWEKEGLIKPERIGTRGDRRYTAEMIGEIKKKGLVSDLAKKAPAQKKDLEEYSKKELIKELQLLKKQKKYGLVWEDHVEEVVERCKIEAPILVAKKDKQIKDRDKNKPTNILIEGDNYHSLQVLNYTHKGKIDVIYIDPPYNTGKEFIYNDKIVDKEDNFKHSKWISFMESRLKLARNLLKKDGVIFISIDDNEQAQLKILCDGVFGQDNFLVNFIWNKKNVVQNDAKFSSINHEYVLSYRKSTEREDFELLERTDEMNSRYVNPDNDPRGDWTSVALQAKSGSKANLYEIEFPNGVKWKPVSGTFPRLNKESLEKAYKEGRLWFGKTGKNVPRLKKYLSEVKQGVVTNSIWLNDEVGSTQAGKEDLKKILNKNIFETPKPKELIKKCINLSTKDPKATILDFMAGSGTTGHAVIDLNKEDDGNRKFILNTNNENNICEDVTLERIKRVIKGYTTPKGKKVKGLGGSLEYFKTEFVDVENIDKVSDKKKLEFTYEAGQMIALKEDAFKEVAKNKFYQIFTDEKDKFVGIYFRENLDKLAEMEKKILDKKDVKLYLFSYGVNDYKKDYAEYKNVTVKDIPEPILKIYKRLNN